MSREEGRALEAEIARRAIAAAEKRANEPDAEKLRERLEEAVGPDGRLGVDAAVDAITGDGERPPWNPFADAAAQEPQRPSDARLWPSLRETEGSEPGMSPKGDIDASKGTAPAPPVEHVQSEKGMERMEIFDLNDLNNDKENSR